ncbi:uncharacterized protein KY384_001823 [Bacidia gigantensis]|uniref:uncharacterized protein n=1 Tax=Bacidia gigantensis TaxID=2732470 RepID=UPI001D0486B7|nr:uncharacterized protein KY384_001823 [Bacidia gigantensis]KAG8533040.1 hypothetical protein KY384_001823 [Bacidia gigantensis]
MAGALSANIASDDIGLISSTQCGIWEFNVDAGIEAADLADLSNHRKEVRAGQYARTCYEPSGDPGAFSCGLFYNQSIAFTTKTHQKCPFSSPNLCLEGAYSAITFETGLVDASVIGINARPTHKFKRSTTCSPLNMSQEFISRVSEANDTRYRYYYGGKDEGNSTFETVGQPFDWLVPVYTVSTYFSSLYPGEDYWHPIPELARPEDTTLTIMFISSAHIYYTKPNLDPIFHAEEPKQVGGLQGTYYFNSDPRARPMACVDKTELCSPDGKRCWSMTSPVPNGVPSSNAYWLMKWALENSNSYDSIKWRLGNALLAQEKISQFVSRPLSPVQWQLEVSQLFATSLARSQFDVLGIGIGEDREKPGYVELTPAEARGHLCGLVKVKMTGAINVHLGWFLLIFALLFLIFFLTWKPKTVGWKAPERGYGGQREAIMIDYIIERVSELSVWLLGFAKEKYRNWKASKQHGNQPTDPDAEHVDNGSEHNDGPEDHD